jgi:hypothetical protein
VKQLKYKLDEYIKKDPSIPTNNSPSSSSSPPSFSLLNPEEILLNWNEKRYTVFYYY